MTSPESAKYRALLVNPPKDKKEADYYTEFLPLNIVAIATRLRLAGGQADIIDSLPGTRDIEDIKAKIKEINGDDLVVGIALYQSNARSALEIAEFCRQIQLETGRSIKVIIGGVNASLFALHYMRQYPSLIDGIVVGHGEDAMIDVCNDRDSPNLLTAAKLENGSKVVPYYDTDLDVGFPYDYGGIDLERYWEHSSRRFSGKGGRFTIDQLDRPLLINTHRGCYKSCKGKQDGQTRKCVFCGGREFKWSGINPANFWRKLEDAIDKTGANCVSDLGDNFVGNPDWFKELVRNRPKGFKYPFKYIFASSDRLCDEDIVRLLAEELQLHAVLNSIEHGDERCQAAFGKSYTAEQTERSLLLLDKYKIASRLSFVIGAPRTRRFEGESEKTINNFVEYAGRIAERNCIQVILGNVLNPSPGSKIWNLMMRQGKYRELYKSMLPCVDHELMSWHYFEEFTNISRERAVEAMVEIMGLFGEDVIKGETV